jgi:hypothetical protein
VPCSASGRRKQYACPGGPRCPVSESVKTGTLARGAAVAVIALAGLGRNLPIQWERHGGVQAAELVRTRLRLLLTTGRDTPVESALQGMPPDEAMGQGSDLRSVPSPMAEGPGRQNPTVVHRPVGL